MDTLKANIKHALNCIGKDAIDALLPEVLAAKKHLVNGDAALTLVAICNSICALQFYPILIGFDE